MAVQPVAGDRRELAVGEVRNSAASGKERQVPCKTGHVVRGAVVAPQRVAMDQERQPATGTQMLQQLRGGLEARRTKQIAIIGRQVPNDDQVQGLVVDNVLQRLL